MYNKNYQYNLSVELEFIISDYLGKVTEEIFIREGSDKYEEA